jgi:hypothetical protein
LCGDDYTVRHVDADQSFGHPDWIHSVWVFESNFGPRPPAEDRARARELVAQDDKKNDPTFIEQPAAWIVHG